MKDKKNPSLSDEALIKAITQEGQSELYGQLYDRYSDKVYRKCIGFAKDHEVAQDMVQDIFLKVFFQLPKFKGKSRFSTWLYAITYNYCVEHYRRTSKHTFLDIEDEPDVPSQEDDEKELLEARSEVLKQALDKIGHEDRTILLLKYQYDVSIKEIMEMMEISESAVKMRLARARKRAKESMVELEKNS